MNLDIRNPEQVISDSNELMQLASRIEGEISNLQSQKATILQKINILLHYTINTTKRAAACTALFISKTYQAV